MTQQKKRIAPFSLRLTPEERAQLEKAAGGLSLGAYIHSRLFSGNSKKRTRGKHPVKDYQALAQIQGRLAQLIQLAKLKTSQDTKEDFELLEDIRWIRNTLITALGLKAENNYPGYFIRKRWRKPFKPLK